MRKFTLTAAFVSFAASIAVIGYGFARNADGTSAFAQTASFASRGLNDYGCVSNCTAEYQIDHVYRLLEDKPNDYHIDGVRFKVRYTCSARSVRWFKDLGNADEIVISTQIKANLGCLLTVIGREQGFTNFKEGDEVAFFGSLSKVWDPWGVQKVLQIENPVYYMRNGVEDLSLLESPVYIQ